MSLTVKIVENVTEVIGAERLHLFGFTSINENLFMFMLMLISTTENNSLNLVYYILVNFRDLEGRKHIIIIYEKNASACHNQTNNAMEPL